MSCTFRIDLCSAEQGDEVTHLEPEEKAEVDELIEEGKAEESDNRRA